MKKTVDNRKYAIQNGIDSNLINIYTKQKGIGRQVVYVAFNKFYFGEIDDLYLCDVYPNINEHFDNYDEFHEEKQSHEEIMIERYSEEMIKYLDSIKEEQ